MLLNLLLLNLLLIYFKAVSWSRYWYAHSGTLNWLLLVLHTVNSLMVTSLSLYTILLVYIVPNHLHLPSIIIADSILVIYLSWTSIGRPQMTIITNWVNTCSLNGVDVRWVEMPACQTMTTIIDKLVLIAIFIPKITLTLSANEIFTVSFPLMDASLASLPKLLLTTINATHKRLLSRVRKHMLSQILLKRKLLITVVTLVRLLYLVHLHVPLQTVFSFELCFAIQYVAQK